jgi:hypothetical protein
MADGTKIADCPAGADRDCVDHEPQLFTVNNLFNILQQTSVNAIMAVGMTLVILTSGSICPSVPCWRSPVRSPLRLSALRSTRWWPSPLPWRQARRLAP